MFSEAKELSANLSYFSGIDAQVAYSVSDHIAVMANGNVMIENPGFSESASPPSPHHLFGESGIGWFASRNDIYYEIFGGYGASKGYSLDKQPISFDEGSDLVVKRKYNRIFLQPSIGLNAGETMLIFTTRLSAVNFSSYAAVIDTLNQFITPPRSGYQIFFEPSITLRFKVGSRVAPLRAYFQLGVNGPLQVVNYRYNIFQISGGFNFPTRLSRKNGD
jgi:hypothetical protein